MSRLTSLRLAAILAAVGAVHGVPVEEEAQRMLPPKKPKGKRPGKPHQSTRETMRRLKQMGNKGKP